MTQTDTDSVTKEVAIDAWREEHSLSDAEAAVLSQPGCWFYNTRVDGFIRVVDKSPTGDADEEEWVVTEGMSGWEGEYPIGSFWRSIRTGELEPVPDEVVENAEEITTEIAAYELEQLDTLSSDSEYNVVEHTETYADAYNAVRLARCRKSTEDNL